MLDALLAEARLRWGLDPAAGLAVVVAERLIATPVEPSLPVLVVPAARLRAAAPGPDAGSSSASCSRSPMPVPAAATSGSPPATRTRSRSTGISAGRSSSRGTMAC